MLATPTASSAAVAQPGTMPRPMVSNPNMMPTRPTALRAKPARSSGGGRSSRVSGMKMVASTSPSTAIGMLIQKIQRQWK